MLLKNDHLQIETELFGLVYVPMGFTDFKSWPPPEFIIADIEARTFREATESDIPLTMYYRSAISWVPDEVASLLEGFVARGARYEPVTRYSDLDSYLTQH